ncbi:hypothetical protein HII36_29880 [Nonomuraea sp. NN258]|uniref:hypothetical protein n=1 Tax=Nonomuraea antri TaxID=2730852 RepID=UPI0015685788|nr:hypothetical protein [Nonomuraea antri]NRQ36011.1 hypothetical protein [Nonomuraea antri]
MIIELDNGDYITTQELRDMEHEPEPDPDAWHPETGAEPQDAAPVEYSTEPPF